MAHSVRILYIIFLAFANSITHSFASELPIVDLGYEKHQALIYNASGGFYNFSNIRYGRPPVGNLRWRAPQEPLPNLQHVQKGEIGRICPQAFPSWYAAIRPSQSGNETLENLAKTNPAYFIPPPDPRENEDCLFLDVIVPAQVFNHTTTKKKYSGAPVLIWFYGGGFTFTDTDGSPAGLIKRSQERPGDDEGIIYVKFNYRGGAFGFLSGPEVRANGSANAGLLDQRAALLWVQKYIHLFGGDPERVTAFGQSAGAGSILHQLTAYGGLKGAAPFNQAILQSPGFQPYPSNFQQDAVFKSFLALTNVTTLDDARKLPYEVLQKANRDIVAPSPNGLFTFSPTMDGSFAPGLPGQALASGNYDKSVKVMVGHNSNETLFFVNEDTTSDSDFRENLHVTFATIPPSIVDFIAEDLYPPTNNTWTLTEADQFGYWSEFGRRIVSSSDASFVCNAHWAAQAASKSFRNQTFEYLFALEPGFHGQDVPYLFYNGDDSTQAPPVNGTVARWLQTYITEFAIAGKPNREGSSAPLFPPYAESPEGEKKVLRLDDQGSRVITDPDENERCEFWQKALFY